MNKIKIYISFSFLSLVLFIFAACSEPLEQQLVNDKSANGSGKNGFVRIYIGETNASSRTVQPKHDALAGYQLTFSGSVTRNPVNITEGNSADVSLADGSWTITAKAYKSGGVIGNSSDEVASGSISITVSSGAVSGTVPAIILRPSGGTGNGTLKYIITVDSGISGYLKLFEINGYVPVSTFGTSGMVSLSDSVNSNFDISAGRYIVEVKLTNSNNKVAFLREVVEIWEETATAFVFTPVSDDFVDPSALLANSKAVLSEIDSKINDVPIGSGTGNGTESDPKTYKYSTVNAGNVSIVLIAQPDSLFATYSWAVTSGAAPGAYSEAEFPTNFSENNVLWIKAVSEDCSTTMYYKFVITPPPPPSNGTFTDEDYQEGFIAGTIRWDIPSNSEGIDGYRIYFGTNETTKSGSALYTIASTWDDSQVVTRRALPANMKYFLIYSYGSSGAEFPECFAIPIADIKAGGTFGDFTVTSTSASGFTWNSPDLIITQNGLYYITGTGSETTDRIQVMGSAITPDIVLKNVNINVNSLSNISAFDTNVNNNEGVTVNLTLEGTNNLSSGENKSGLRVPSNGTLVITGNGSLNVNGGGYGAGIGGDRDTDTGVIIINSGNINAKGNWGGAGIGGSYRRTGGKITITGGSITAEGVTRGPDTSIWYGGTGIGGGYNAAGGEINISGGIINATGGNYNPNDSYYLSGSAGIGGGATGGTGGVISISGGIITAFAGSWGAAGIGGGGGLAGTGRGGGAGGTINISGGVITTRGSGENSMGSGRWSGGAGIGGGSGAEGGIITISGAKIEASGGGSYNYPTGRGAAGIGGGLYEASGIINISNSVITASHGGEAFDIGNGFNYGSNNITINDSVIFAGSAMPELWEGDNINNSIIFIGNDCIMYGNVTLTQNIIIPSLIVLSITTEQSLTISNNIILTNNGIINNSGKIINSGIINCYGIINNIGTGNISGNQPEIFFGGIGYPIPLSLNTWSDGYISLSGDQWFKFTATADTQYIHIYNNSASFQLCDSNINTIGSQTQLYGNYYISISVAIGEEYYIRLSIYNNNPGAFRITFNDSSTAPAQ